MRLYLFSLVLVVLVISFTEGGKKNDWREKKMRSKSRHANAMDERQLKGLDDEEMMGPRHFDKHNHYNKKMKKHHKKDKFGKSKHMPWLNIKKGSDCELECQRGEVCITGPIDAKPMCVRKKDLKKSMKLFHRYQKKEMKAWKKFQKKKYNHVAIDDIVPVELGSKDDLDMKELMEEKHRLYAEKHGFDHHMEKSDRKADHHPIVVPNDKSLDACSTSEFSQMRSRLMGWFHLLHGQDHQARKDHGGNIKHFYKHVSVKKELREHGGNKCECLKSAMWQFHQMDGDANDSLDDVEMSLLEENAMEPCMKPFITSCDLNADQKLSSDEWCCCFSSIVAPCFNKLDAIKKSAEKVTFVPRCDKEGYYMREQCQGDSENTYECWCVDYNGNEIKGTYNNGRAHCSKIPLNGDDKKLLH